MHALFASNKYVRELTPEKVETRGGGERCVDWSFECLQSNEGEVSEAQANGKDAGAPLRFQQQQQHQESSAFEKSGFAPPTVDLRRNADEPPDGSVPHPVPQTVSAPFEKKSCSDLTERASGVGATASGGGGGTTQGPTVAEALWRLAAFRLDKLNIESPVNPEKNPRDAIRVAEALAPFPSGIRFDKSTFR